MPSAINETASSARREHPSSFRPDIEGLRAFAVGLVVLDHLFGWPEGGFVGVDVFYVLSGFLITGLLLREHARSGWISFSAFYARRVRRILPAAVLVLVATTIAAYIVWYAPQANQTLLDSLAALFFVANWHFIAAGTDYLQAAGPVSPVQHYWSLSVEEQFYVAWPWLMLALLILAGRRATKRGFGQPSHRTLTVVIVAVVAVTFAYSVYSTRTNPDAAYFDTFARVWELAAGALLAVLSPRLHRISRRIGRWIAWGGLVLLLIGSYVIDPAWLFPGPWAAIPVVATMLIIAGGASGHSISPLDNPVSRYLGKISYSLYLWHWPVIVFALALAPEPSAATVLLMIVIMLGLSVLSFHFVEDRIRRSRWLQPDAAAVQHRRRQLIGAALVGAVIVGLSVAQLRGPSVVVDADELAGPAVSDATPHDWSDRSVLDASLQQATRATGWPDGLTPSLASLSSKDAPWHMDKKTGCRNSVGDATDPLVCERPGGAGTIAVVGDSVALSWIAAIEEAYPDARVVGVGFGSCPAVPASVGSVSFASDCAEEQDFMLRWAAELQPDVVFTSSAQGVMPRVEEAGDWGEAASEFFEDYGTITDAVVMIGNPPVGKDPRECVTRLTGPAACESKLTDAWTAKAEAEAAAAAASGGTYVDVRDWFCDEGGTCPMFMDDVTIRIDSVHITDLESRSLGSTLRAAITPSITP